MDYAERPGTQDSGLIGKELLHVLNGQFTELTFAENRDYMCLGVRPVHLDSVRVTPVKSVCEPISYGVPNGIARYRYRHSVLIISLDFLELIFGFGLGLAAGL